MGRGAKGYLVGVAALMVMLGAGAGITQAAVTADPAVTILYVKGDAEPNQIVVECLGRIVAVNGAPALDGHVSCTDLEKLHVFGFGGDDTITLGGFAEPPSEDPGIAIFDEYDQEQRSIVVSGGDGNDTLSSDASEAIVSGGEGDDLVRGNNAIDAVMAGGPGNDHLVGALGFSFMLAGQGDDRIEGSSVLTFAFAGGGADVFTGHGGSDFVIGGTGRDRLFGHGSTDLLVGAAGSDALFGGSGRDLLVGGNGHDQLRGGPGRDKQFQGGFPSKRQLGGFLEGVGGGGNDVEVAISPRLLRKFGAK
jgi:Ca2+-binding RTX toxin-like protein